MKWPPLQWGKTTWSDLPPNQPYRKTDAVGSSCNVGDQEAEIKLSKQLVSHNPAYFEGLRYMQKRLAGIQSGEAFRLVVN